MHLARLGFVVGIVAVMGCGKIEDDAGGPVGGADPQSSPPASVDPVGNHDAPVVAARRRGTVFMLSGGGGFTAGADFPAAASSPAAPPTAPCTFGLIPHETDASQSQSESAGNIFVEVPGPTGILSSTLSFDASTKSYQSATLVAPKGQDRVEKGGAPIHVRAKGAGVPAFDATVAAAFDTTIVEPTEGTVLSRKKPGDLVVRWTDEGNESVSITFTNYDARISCSFPASAKQGVIPAALVKQALATTEVGECKGCVTLDLWSFRASHVSAGDYDVSLLRAAGGVRQLTAE